MAKPGMDEDLLLSVSPRVEKKHPDDEVREIVDSLHSSTYLHPTVQSFLQDAHQKDLFMEMIARQANMIKSRCQSFEDGQVTVFDKVLLHLTENGNRFDSVTAQEYFCEEFLGINKNGTPIHIERILRENTVMKAFIAQAVYPNGKYGEKYTAETKYDHKSRNSPEAFTAVSKEDDIGTNTARLASIYEKAKSDFEAVPSGDTMAKLDAARFLRDTAENTVMYFRDPTKTGDTHITSTNMEDLIADLEATCKMAQASVVTLSGGRKRKFDRHDYEVFPHGKRGGGGYRGKSYRQRNDSAARYYSAGRGCGQAQGGRVSKKWQDPNRDIGGGDGGGRRHRRRSVELFPQTSTLPSRGDHAASSSFLRPFGYSRPVDSYQPGDDPAPFGGDAHPYQHHHHQTPEPTASAAYGYGYDTGAPRQQQGGQGQHADDFLARLGQDYGHEQGHGHDQGYGYGYGYGQQQQQQEQQQHQYGPGGEGEGEGGYASRRGRRGGNGDGSGGEYRPEMGY